MLKTRITSKVTLWENFDQNLGKSIIFTTVKFLGIPVSKRTDVSISHSVKDEKKKTGFIS